MYNHHHHIFKVFLMSCQLQRHVPSKLRVKFISATNYMVIQGYQKISRKKLWRAPKFLHQYIAWPLKVGTSRLRDWLSWVFIRLERKALIISYTTISWHKRLRWAGGSGLAFGTQVRRFARSRSRRIFRTKKKSSARLSFGGEVKPLVPCRRFTACKRSLNVKCKSAFRQNSRTFLAHSSTFCRWVLSRGDMRGDVWWRKLERLTHISQ
jgi:hypothetical protein